MALEVAMKIQHFQQRSLLLHDPWKWLLTEFAAYYGVSEVYTKLRYLSYIMDVATPTANCLILVHDLLLPVITKGHSKSTLSHQENRILGEIEDQIEQILVLVFKNYKSLDESQPSGMMDVFRPATGSPAPALAPAIKLYMEEEKKEARREEECATAKIREQFLFEEECKESWSQSGNSFSSCLASNASPGHSYGIKVGYGGIPGPSGGRDGIAS